MMEINLCPAKKCWASMKEKGVDVVVVCSTSPISEVDVLVGAKG
jgi:2',3'-cyclic-nucleotide 2'-phosphodiesterase (5'-nucleotidase family)